MFSVLLFVLHPVKVNITVNIAQASNIILFCTFLLYFPWFHIINHSKQKFISQPGICIGYIFPVFFYMKFQNKKRVNIPPISLVIILTLFFLLTFYSTGRNTFNDMFLTCQVNNNNWNDSKHNTCHHWSHFNSSVASSEVLD